MKFLTLNIWNYVRPWNERRAAIADLIQQHQPDVVALQEARHDFRFEHGRGQADQLAGLTDMVSTWALGQVYVPILRVDEGVALLTRKPPTEVQVRYLSIDPHQRDDQNQRLCLHAVVEVAGNRTHCFVSHFSLSQRARQTNAQEVFRFVQESAGPEPAILMGDLNAEPDAPEILFLTGDYELDGERGDFQDCWTLVHPDDPGYTYGSAAPVRRIDYVLSRNAPTGPIGAQIVADQQQNGVYPSDHMGIVVEFP